ncbi:MAG: hypothetical protein Q4B65_01720, partial [Candidatus Saccharibacteria bacterium]|nr:hypothetical protein [Candidatus Saccharibacteria bacterium]
MHSLVGRIQATVVQLTSPNLIKIILKALIYTAITAAGLGIVFILLGTWGDLQARIMTTALALLIFYLPALLLAKLFQNENLRLFTVFGFLFAAVAALSVIVSIWGGEVNNGLPIFIGSVATFAGFIFSTISKKVSQKFTSVSRPIYVTNEVD